MVWVGHHLEVAGMLCFFVFFFKGRNPLVVQWLGLGAFTAVACVQSLVREIRSHRSRGVSRKRKGRKREYVLIPPSIC